MAINIGDNFGYNGKKYLDYRQSFETLEEMRAFSPNNVPEGFVTYCKEDGKRYEFKNGNWVRYSASGGAAGDCSYFGDEEPEDEEVIWFTGSVSSATSDLEFDNPVIVELFKCIRELQSQVQELQAEVEYLKINGGGGIPEWPDMPDPDEPVEEDVFLALEDGSLFLLEDGEFILLEEKVIVEPSQPTPDSLLALEDGDLFLLEDGGFIVLEEAVITPLPPQSKDSILLLEDGDQILYEDGSNILLEG